ncbi:MAG: class I SAM-dependent methyltransferase, partial [Propionibacteriaceae bacterium]|nr:class I SAM-dependent methyltransferase [Propionibacteriaceae bacterium]
MEQAALDRRIQQFYSRFAEAERLTTMSAAGRLELERIQELLRARLKPGSHIIDVGGATGVHATWLAAEGHDVVLVDPIASQVEIAAQAGIFTAVVGDARCLDFAAGSFDAALLFGPLYHLHSRDDRLRALGEAKRVVCPGGLVFAVGISRCSAIVAGMLATIPETADERVIGLINDG